MGIVDLHERHLPALYDIYRAATAGAAHCRLVPSLEYFATALQTPARPETRILVAHEAGIARGFAAFLPVPPDDDGTTHATITALFADGEQAEQELVAACVETATTTGVQELHAFAADHGRCPVPGYNVGWDGLSDALPSVARLLARNSFVPTYRELLLSCDLRRFPPVVSPPPAGVTVERRVPEDGGWTLVPFLDGASAGRCSYSTLAKVVDDPAAARVGYVWGIGVAETARRRGIARYLMEQILAHLVDQGCDACWLSTGATNWPAQPLYLSLGFEIVDATASFRRVIR